MVVVVVWPTENPPAKRFLPAAEKATTVVVAVPENIAVSEAATTNATRNETEGGGGPIVEPHVILTMVGIYIYCRKTRPLMIQQRGGPSRNTTMEEGFWVCHSALGDRLLDCEAEIL